MGRRSQPRSRKQTSKKPRPLRFVLLDFSDANFDAWARFRNEQDPTPA
jgi:hypothetical protein